MGADESGGSGGDLERRPEGDGDLGHVGPYRSL